MTLTPEQLAKRKLGSSDAAVACGLEVFGRTRYQLWAEMTGRAERPDISGEPQIRRGNYVEQFAAAEYEHERGVKLRNRSQQVSSDYPWMSANIDRHVVGAHRIVECKAPGPFAFVGRRATYGEDGSDQVPDYVAIQVVHQGVVLQWDEEHDVATLSGEDFRVYTLPWNDDLAGRVIELEREFWHLVETDTQPELTTEEDVRTAFASVVAEPIVATPEIADAVADYKRAKKYQGAWETAADSLRLGIALYMREHENLKSPFEDKTIATFRRQQNKPKTDWEQCFRDVVLRVAADGTLDEDDVAQIVRDNTHAPKPYRRFLPK